MAFDLEENEPESHPSLIDPDCGACLRELATDLADALHDLAEDAGVPDSFWDTDRRIRLATRTLEVHGDW